MQIFSISPKQLLVSIDINKALIASLVKRDILARYKGSALGLVWALLHPVFMMLVYTFVFSVVFKARWNAGSDSKTEFALVLFAGLLVYNFFAECVNKSPGLVVANSNYVKKVVFPLEILPLVLVGSALFHLGISLVVWFVTYIVFFGFPQLTSMLIAIVLIPLVFLTMGLCWFFCSLGVYLRDIAQIIGILTTMLMFLSPIFYPASSLPTDYQFLFYWNPLTVVIETARDVLYWGKYPNWSVWLLQTMVSFAVACAGFAWFQKTRKGFADVL